MTVSKRTLGLSGAAIAVGLSLAGPQAAGLAWADDGDAGAVSSTADRGQVTRAQAPTRAAQRPARVKPRAAASGAASAAGPLDLQPLVRQPATEAASTAVRTDPRPASAARTPRNRAPVPAERSRVVEVGPARAVATSPLDVTTPKPTASTGAQAIVHASAEASQPSLFAAPPSPAVIAAAANNAVQGLLDSVQVWLSGLPANPFSDFLAGSLLLLRRGLLNQAPLAESTQSFVGEPPDFRVVAAVDASDPEGDSLTYTVLSEPTFGTVTVAVDGTFTYIPQDPVRFTTDSFTVAVSDRGFNLLDPFSDRSATVEVEVARPSLAGYSQGFDIINLTDKVLWLTKAGVNDKTLGYPQDWVNDSCNDHGFCLNSLVGRSLLPGEAIPFQATTDPDIFVYLMFSSNDGQNWGVRVLPRYKNDSTIIDNFYGDVGTPAVVDAYGNVPDRPDWAWPVGATPGRVAEAKSSWELLYNLPGRNKYVVDWSSVKTGTWSATPLQPVAYSTQTGTRLFLTQGTGQTFTITGNTTWSGAPPSWCGYCQPVDTVKNGLGALVDPQTVLNNFLKANPAAPDGSSYPQYQGDFTPSYRNLKFLNFATDLASSDQTGSRIEVLNEAGNEGVTVTRSGTIELNPGPGTEQDPNAPWWKGPASQAASGVASFLLGKFVGQGIADAVGSAIGGFLAPAQVPKTIRATTTTAQVTPAPHSYSVMTTIGGVSRYLVTGDVTYTIPTNGGGTTTFVFQAMDFVINDPTSKGTKEGQTLNAHFETVPYQKAGETNVGFRLSDKASWNQGLGVPNTNPTYRVDPGTEHLLGLELYLGSAVNARGEDSSGKVCGGDKTTNCATITIVSDDPAVDVAEIKVLGSNQAVLIAKAPGTATVTATYNWSIDIGGPLQKLTGTVKATMGVKVTA